MDLSLSMNAKASLPTVLASACLPEDDQKLSFYRLLTSGVENFLET